MMNTNLLNFEDTFLLENIIYNELLSRSYQFLTGKTYKGEVDFVVIDGRKNALFRSATTCMASKPSSENSEHLS